MIHLMGTNKDHRKDFKNDSGGGSVGGPKIQNEEVESEFFKKEKRNKKKAMMFTWITFKYLFYEKILVNKIFEWLNGTYLK